jgi:glycyl-tRNA synthetase (class II)
VTFQIKALPSTTVLASLGVPNARLASAGSRVFDLKALADSVTAVDSFALPVTITFQYAAADIEVSVFPLMKKDELIEIANSVSNELSQYFIVDYDASGSIGKRYLRSQTSGTPVAITIDFDSVKGKDVTVRDRDTGKQERVKIKELIEYLREKLGKTA